jgi:hypothetical protein
MQGFIAAIRKWLGADKKQEEKPASTTFSTGA